MSKREKRKFVNDLIGAIAGRIKQRIELGSIPEEWDGHELRQYIADLFANEVCRWVMTGSRMRDYRNTVSVTADL